MQTFENMETLCITKIKNKIFFIILKNVLTYYQNDNMIIVTEDIIKLILSNFKEDVL